jgi:hypothetical protein
MYDLPQVSDTLSRGRRLVPVTRPMRRGAGTDAMKSNYVCRVTKEVDRDVSLNATHKAPAVEYTFRR